MPLTVRLPCRIAAAGVVFFLLSACGGGGSGNSSGSTAPPSPNPSTTPPAPSPSPVANVDSFPKDYQLVYRSPSQGIITVPANALSSRTVRTTAMPTMTARIDDGEWSGTTLINRRPYVLAFLDGSSWKTLALRSTDPQQVMSTALSEPQRVCGEAVERLLPDYATPLNSLMFYRVAGSDGQCQSGDDVLSSVRLSDGGRVNLGISSWSRAFYGSNGNINSYLAVVGSELRLYTPGTGSFQVVASSIVNGEVIEVAATADVAWLSWSNGPTSAIYRIGADGSVSAPLYSTRAFIYVGGVDAEAMYISHRISDSESQVIKVPFSGSSTVLATTDGVSQVVAASRSALLLLRAASDASGLGYLVLSKGGGSPVPVSATASQSLPIPFSSFSEPATVTTRNEFLINLLGSDGSTTAILVNEQGQITERLAKSEWIAASYNDRDFGTPTLPLAGRALQVQSYSGTRHQGGGLVIWDLASGSRSTAATLTQSGVLQAARNANPVDLAQRVTTSSGGAVDVDLFGFDLNTPQFTQLTTSSDREEILD